MAIVVRYPQPGATREQYDESIRRGEQLGDIPPDGLEYHVAFVQDDGTINVTEIWDSQEKMDAFGERLIPILAEIGINVEGQPEILEVHNIIRR